MAEAVTAYAELVKNEGAMLVTLEQDPGSAFSDLIGQRMVHALSCSGPALDHALGPVDLLAMWQQAETKGIRLLFHEFLYEGLCNGTLTVAKGNWVLAAALAHLPMIVPGWENSRIGSRYAAACLSGQLRRTDTVRSGLEAMLDWASWYAQTSRQRPMGYLQIGDGIAGAFPMRVVPMLQLHLHQAVPAWSYGCHLTATVSAAPPVVIRGEVSVLASQFISSLTTTHGIH